MILTDEHIELLNNYRFDDDGFDLTKEYREPLRELVSGGYFTVSTQHHSSGNDYTTEWKRTLEGKRLLDWHEETGHVVTELAHFRSWPIRMGNLTPGILDWEGKMNGYFNPTMDPEEAEIKVTDDHGIKAVWWNGRRMDPKDYTLVSSPNGMSVVSINNIPLKDYENVLPDIEVEYQPKTKLQQAIDWVKTPFTWLYGKQNEEEIEDEC